MTNNLFLFIVIIYRICALHCILKFFVDVLNFVIDFSFDFDVHINADLYILFFVLPVIVFKIDFSNRAPKMIFTRDYKPFQPYTEKSSSINFMEPARVADTVDYRTKFCKIHGTFQDKNLKFEIFSWKFHILCRKGP